MVSMSDVVTGVERWHVQHADCLFALSCLPDACIDSIVTDPPYGLGSREPAAAEIIRYLQGEELDTGGDFMGKRWSVPSVAVWSECLRVLKPGGHVLAFGGTRTFDLISLGLRAAGFQFRDTISGEGVLRWYYSQGMPKSLNVGKAIDKAAGAERPVIGSQVLTGSAALSLKEKGGTYASNTKSEGKTKTIDVTGPATDDAKQWDGWGSALKPSWEPILVFRKPLDGTVVDTVLTHGTGAININACRLPNPGGAETREGEDSAERRYGEDSRDFAMTPGPRGGSSEGRWPPNVVFTHLPGCTRAGTKRIKPGGGGSLSGSTALGIMNDDGWVLVRPLDADGLETVEAWDCAEGCPVAALDAQSGDCPAGISVTRNGGGRQIFGSENRGGAVPDGGYTDSGGASRFFHQFQPDPALAVGFFYTAKASRTERDAGLDGERNSHVSVKPVELMRFLVRLVTPPQGLVLDPYVGSGTTGVAVMLEEGAFRFLGIEREPEDVANAEARIKYVVGGRWQSLEEIAQGAAAAATKKQLALF